ncbi:MAG: enoyl-CoA hydratase/isomerase family protein [Ignavibacteria bacterium]|jgi:enoyl-CoA hydratase
MQNDVLHLEITAGVAVVTLHRPDKLNALNAELLRALESTFTDIQSNEDVRVVVVTGSGPKAFAAGADIAELASQSEHSGRIFAERGQRVFTLIERLGVPVIAAVNGFALGGGCELAMACHMRFAADTARFGQPEINLGIIPGYGGTQRLPRLVGMAKALELILSGDMIDAQEAHKLGLVNRIYPHAELLEKTLEFAKGLASKAPLALRACLEATQSAGDTSLLEGLFAEASVFGRTCGTEDFGEGTKAFLEKRPASFSGK